MPERPEIPGECARQGVTHRAELCPTWAKRIDELQQVNETMLIPQTTGLETKAKPWWALYTRHQHEKTVADMLSAKGFEVFLPLYESERQWKDRVKKLSLPLFPCYVFVRGDLNRQLQAITTPGVHMVLSRGERVALIPEEEMEGIRRVVEEPCRIEPHPYLECGERVRVARGCLEGVEGILIRRKSQYRLVLSVDTLAQSVAVEVDASDVEPVSVRGAAGAYAAGHYAGGEVFSA